eukprot:g15381.t1
MADDITLVELTAEDHLEMAKLLLEKGARAERLNLRLAQNLREVGADASLLLPCFVRHASLPDVRECIDAGCLDINAEIHLGHETTRVISTFRDCIDSVIELMWEGARCESLAIGGSSALQDFSRDRQNVHTSLTNKALCRNVQAAYETLEGFSLEESQTLLELETELENKNIPDSFWQQVRKSHERWKKMLQKTISAAEYDALVAEAQARLLEIWDPAKLQEVYDRYIDGDHATYCVNKLRGLLFQALTKEFGDDLAKLRAEEEHDDTQLRGLIQDLGDVAEIFTRVCADHTVEVVDPVWSQRIEDTTCAVETVEEANTKQLSLILSALSETLFFRLFKVDMQAKCQYDFEKQRWLDDDFLDLGGEAQDSSDIAGGAPPGSSGAERGGSAAARERGTSKGGAEVGSGTEWEDDLDGADDEDLDLDDDDDSDAHSTSTDRGEDVDNQPRRSTDTREKVDEPFECGGAEQVGGGVAQLMQKPDNLMTSEAKKPSKSACTVEAEEAPAFADPAVDRVKTQAERTFSHAVTASNCAEDAPEFWLDMCAKVGEAGSRAEFINLKKNPETNTGYNGRHIWEAMYSENCFSHERMMKKNTGSDDHSHMADWDNTTAAALAAFRSGATNSGTAKGGVGGSNAVALASADDGRCFEERVLYRLLSGLHSCTTISILYNFYPPQTQTGESASASAISWGKNPGPFMQVFARHPERLKNLYFAFIVLLRATKKAGNFLSTYKWQTGDALEDGKIRELVQRLLDSDKLGSFCASAFGGFDERSMFLSTHVSRREFKKGFQRISALMSCVKCNRCRLHGKLHILGIGAALKILLLTEELLPNSLSREEVVALFNTLHAFSESLIHATELLSLYQWASRSAGAGGVGEMKTEGSGAGGEAEKEDDEDEDDGEDAAEDGVTAEPRGEDGLEEGEDVETVSELLTRAGGNLDRALTRIQADAAGPDLRGRAMENKSSGPAATTRAADAQLLANLQNDVAHALAGSSVTSSPAQLSTDLVVVGSGLAGMTTALTALEGGASVVLLEKEPRFGGNTGKASSGINGALMWGELEDSRVGEKDSLEAFVQDTMRSGGGRAVPSRVQKLVAESDAALKWLQKAGVDIGLKAVLGGHSAPRTYRPATGNFIGTEVVMVLDKRLREFAGSGQLTILTDARAEGLLTEFGLLGATPTAEDEDEPSPSYRVIGVHGKLQNQSRSFRVLAEHTVLATGGFGHDHAKKGSLLWEHRPDLKKFPTTLGQWTTGDGIKMILALPGTALVDMEYVQVHPTGFVDPKEPAAATKTLAAEVLRGVGGILLNEDGERFCDELGTRQYVVDRMLEQTKHKEARSARSIKQERQQIFVEKNSPKYYSGRKEKESQSYVGSKNQQRGAFEA